jgi:UDP-N-acetylmuramate dehydrogenase
MTKLTWFRLGGRARYLFRPRDEKQLSKLLLCTRREGVPVKVLGAGANVLVSDDGFDGVVVRLDAPAFKRVSQDGDRCCVGAGVDLMPFAREKSYEGHTGLECMAGIPATVGGATRMNAGGAHGEFSDVVTTVRVVGRDGSIQDRSRESLGFGYRQSKLDGLIVTSVELELPDGDPQRTRNRFDEIMANKVESQPIAENSAGCIFKNPPGHAAGALIDRAGLKGVSVGDASVSERHANFIIAGKSATASDVIALIDVVRERVSKEFDIDLEVEVDIWRPTTQGSLV